MFRFERMPDFGGIPMGESPTTSSTPNRHVATDEALAQAIAESMPGWARPEQYDENREWLTRHQSGRPDYTDDDFERGLARMNERLDRVNAAALDMAREHVAAIRPLIDAEIRAAITALPHEDDCVWLWSADDLSAEEACTCYQGTYLRAAPHQGSR